MENITGLAETALDRSFNDSVWAGMFLVGMLIVCVFIFFGGRAYLKLRSKMYNDDKEIRISENKERKAHRERLESSFSAVGKEVQEIRTDVASLETKVAGIDTRVNRLEDGQ